MKKLLPKETYYIQNILQYQNGKYLIKWIGYSQPTWEPPTNLSPLLITSFWTAVQTKTNIEDVFGAYNLLYIKFS